MYQSPCTLPERGYWCRPTLFTGVSQSNRVVQEEIFGPVLAIQTFRTLEEGLEKANNTPYGLSGGIWTDKGAKIFKMTRGVRERRYRMSAPIIVPKKSTGAWSKRCDAGSSETVRWWRWGRILAIASSVERIVPWLSITPLGMPVVPEV